MTAVALFLYNTTFLQGGSPGTMIGFWISRFLTRGFLSKALFWTVAGGLFGLG
jgi:hypothetical protein